MIGFLFFWVFVMGYYFAVWIDQMAESIEYPRARNVIGFVTVLWLAFFLSSCATPPLTHAKVSIIHALGQSSDRTGFVFNAEDAVYLSKESSVAKQFFMPYTGKTYFPSKSLVAKPTPPNSWYIDKIEEEQIADQIGAIENPGTMPAPTTGKQVP